VTASSPPLDAPPPPHPGATPTSLSCAVCYDPVDLAALRAGGFWMCPRCGGENVVSSPWARRAIDRLGPRLATAAPDLVDRLERLEALTDATAAHRALHDTLRWGDASLAALVGLLSPWPLPRGPVQLAARLLLATCSPPPVEARFRRDATILRWPWPAEVLVGVVSVDTEEAGGNEIPWSSATGSCSLPFAAAEVRCAYGIDLGGGHVQLGVPTVLVPR